MEKKAFKKHIAKFKEEYNESYYQELENKIVNEFVNEDEIKFIYTKKPYDIKNAEHYFFLDSGLLVVKSSVIEENNEHYFYVEHLYSEIVRKQIDFSKDSKSIYASSNLSLIYENGENVNFNSSDIGIPSREDEYFDLIKTLFKLI
ncbi:hypothetical protein MHI58_06885 [Bacillus sp. FSL K6-2869]|uniref:hypothetical protein n=1 Tax=Bacillus TaxID=1386 RepID=UPI001FACACD5|nr:hypothetical protein [Bacillus altitudinis]MCI9883874.1 hypothetical protein [Bacillus altitudinis]MDI4571717.1 hypothetical protein [Bacillus altitudinis]